MWLAFFRRQRTSKLKLIHLEIKGCEECPHADQDYDGIQCLKADPIEDILTGEEFYKKRLSVKKKYGQPFPPFCPLPDIKN